MDFGIFEGREIGWNQSSVSTQDAVCVLHTHTHTHTHTHLQYLPTKAQKVRGNKWS
jgi:hypothetical protein